MPSSDGISSHHISLKEVVKDGILLIVIFLNIIGMYAKEKMSLIVILVHVSRKHCPTIAES